MEILLGLVILVLDIIAIFSIIGSPYSGLKKLLWILLILFLPVLGLILWYLLGNPGKVKVDVRVDGKDP